MIQRIAFVIFLLIFAVGILGISILRTTSPRYAFSQQPPQEAQAPPVKEPVDYYLAYPGILPDHFLWSFKAARDRVWLFLTTDPGKRAELLLLFADKRVGASRAFLEGGKPELAVSAATKAEKYLEQSVAQTIKARENNVEVGQFLERLALATLKHREVLEELYKKAPEDARPVIAQTIDYPKRLFDQVKMLLIEENRPVPQSPFEQ
ncbi:MAG: DUF5667 domain-containing protein [Patescibacteria group bacterium]